MSDASEPSPLHPEKLTWAVMLGRWVTFARSAVAWPTEGDPGRLRQSVPDLIMLQAVWFALRHLDELPPDEQAVGRDRARVLIERHTQALQDRWGDTMPSSMRELIEEAAAAVGD
jgi:hypothetical protein